MRNLHTYPVAIEPTAQVLEVASCDDGNTVANSWHAAQRLCTPGLDLPFVVTVQNAHVFASHETLDASWFLLCYSVRGFLSSIWLRDSLNGQWDSITIPPEFTGEAVVAPSVRIAFADMEDASRFLTVLAQMNKALIALTRPSERDATELVTILTRSPHVPVLLPPGVIASGT